ncbi:hypothetical protein K474DRAFT_1680716, partial [Panus rudis PR-1116 ss-1]
VDFQKGEQQRNMDYAFVNAINYIQIVLVLMLYDVMCQYWINFLSRIGNAVGISIPATLQIQRGIGLFHVHGHQKDCFARYAPTFIPGCGMVDGEIIETLWSVLNDTASSARVMSINHRQEYLDAHMFDSNFKKMIHMVPTLLRKWKQTLPMVAESQNDFQLLDLAVTPKERKEWGAMEAAAQRDRHEHVEAMDIYDVREAPTKAELEHFLAKEETSGSTNPEGCATWMSLGVSITEKQLLLREQIRKAGVHPSLEERLAIQEDRRKLQSEIDTFTELAPKYLPPRLRSPNMKDADEWENFDDDEKDDEDVLGDHPVDMPIVDVETIPAEKQTISLPSSYGHEVCTKDLESLAWTEFTLRKGQANDALHNLRVAIGHKSFIHRTQQRPNAPTRPYRKRLRTMKDINGLALSIDVSSNIYKLARNAMLELGMDLEEDAADIYKELKKEDVKASTAVVEPNARGQRNEHLSWIWHIRDPDQPNPHWMDELYRVNWLRAKARRDRLAEEKLLLRSEMEWTKNFFEYQAQLWKERGRLSDLERPHAGQSVFAWREFRTWLLLRDQAQLGMGVMDDMLH